VVGDGVGTVVGEDVGTLVGEGVGNVAKTIKIMLRSKSSQKGGEW
jgi:hypothetical protein